MDKATIPTSPGRPAEEDLNSLRQDLGQDLERDLEREENRLNNSRETIRQLLTRPKTRSSLKTDSPADPEMIDSWSSLLASWVIPAAKDSASRHPYSLLLGSALIGAYFAWSKPLRKIVGSVVVATIVRNLAAASIDAGSRKGGRILRNYLKRRPQKKYPAYQKQEHDPVEYGSDMRG